MYSIVMYSYVHAPLPPPSSSLSVAGYLRYNNNAIACIVPNIFTHARTHARTRTTCDKVRACARIVVRSFACVLACVRAYVRTHAASALTVTVFGGQQFRQNLLAAICVCGFVRLGDGVLSAEQVHWAATGGHCVYHVSTECCAAGPGRTGPFVRANQNAGLARSQRTGGRAGFFCGWPGAHVCSTGRTGVCACVYACVVEVPHMLYNRQRSHTSTLTGPGGTGKC